MTLCRRVAIVALATVAGLAAVSASSAATAAEADGVIHVREVTGELAAGGRVVAEEWGVPGSLFGRHETRDEIATMNSLSCSPPDEGRCWERRTATRWSATDPGMTEDYEVQSWAPGDPAVEPVVRFTRPPEGTRTASGPIADIVPSWQGLPPAHGSTYSLYEQTVTDQDSGHQVHSKLWVDEQTRLPLRASSDVTSDVATDTFWTYDPTTRPASDFGSDFFAISRPTNTASETTARSLISLPLGAQLDRETGLAFAGFSLGKRALMGLRTVCFLGAQAVRSYDSTAPTKFDDPSGELHPDPYGPLTFVDVDYGAPQPDGRCALGGTNTPVTLSLRSMRTDSSMGRAYQAAYDRSGTPLDLTAAGGSLLGLRLPLLGGRSIAAHIVDERDGELSALLELGDTTVEVTGTVSIIQLPMLASLLVAS